MYILTHNKYKLFITRISIFTKYLPTKYLPTKYLPTKYLSTKYLPTKYDAKSFQLFTNNVIFLTQ